MTHSNRPHPHSIPRFGHAVVLAFLALAGGCTVAANDDPCSAGACNSNKPVGPVHGVRSDGRVDVTAHDAWPTRTAEPTPLTRGEVASACARLGACQVPTDHTPTAKEDSDIGILTAICAMPDGTEERVIPMSDINERWSYVLREALVAKSCADVLAIKTKRAAGIGCQEDGCYWSSNTPIPKVSCSGDVATMQTGSLTLVRDCSHVYAHCSTSSPTGCTDRGPVACDPNGIDRCDGDVKLGCDHSGRVSFHDCAVVGRKCVEDAGGAQCVPQLADTCSLGSSCEGTTLSVCVDGAKANVDCPTLGFTKCQNGHCAP
jgi:hypothetical protein